MLNRPLLRETRTSNNRYAPDSLNDLIQAERIHQNSIKYSTQAHEEGIL